MPNANGIINHSHAKTPSSRRSLPHSSISLHLLAHFQVDIKKFRYASIQADRLPLVQIRFAIIGRNAFLGAGLDQAIWKKILVDVIQGRNRQDGDITDSAYQRPFRLPARQQQFFRTMTAADGRRKGTTFWQEMVALVV